jgi:hypothetical protein
MNRHPPSVTVINALRNYDHPNYADGFIVTFLKAGDVFCCHVSHESQAQAQLGDDITFRPVEGDEDIQTTLREDRVLVRWRDLGLVFPDNGTPPPAHFVLLRVDDTREHTINALRAAIVRAFDDEESASIWARACAASLTLG